MRTIICAFYLICFFSCKKPVPINEETVTSAGKKKVEIKKQVSQNPNARMSDCAYFEKLTEVSPGVWKGIYKGTWVTFNNLHVRVDRLYGNFIGAQNATIVDGGETSRTFAFEVASCTGGLSYTKTVTEETFTEFNSKTSNNAYVYYNSSVSSFSDFLIDLYNSTIDVGISTYVVNQYKYFRTRYQFNSVPDCSNAQLFIGKLIGIYNSTTRTYEWGIAPACFEDSRILLD